MSKKILIVEDEPNILVSLIFLLEHAGFEVATETNGKAAMEAIQNNLPDTLVLDVMLPDMDGFEILKTLRNQDRTKSLPILMLTAKGQSEDRNNALKFGADKFVTKPFSNTEVVDAINSLTE